ncbi:protein YIF1B-A-like isoform X2 [Anneissia japonica]|uniref:protein YIF1B-A-like isoform X2 n=1 Tax=Anneissia japonica TaxID=1529436 RepID=UPI00142570D0|nr:protein YIF1B-A-like isoform X2 [Anneissia japonica]
MDVPPQYNVRNPHQGQGHQRKSQRSRMNEGPTPLFEDTSTMPNPQQQYVGGQPGYGGPQQQPGFPGQQYINDPMANMAVQYGASLAGQGKDVLEQKIDRIMSVSKLKYYFAVDTSYVGRKLGLLLFPYTHTNWTVNYRTDEPVAPRYEINAPDLYIPTMAFVTYLLLAGVALGRQDRFTPELLGMQASSALVWLVIEIVAVIFTLYVMNINSALKSLDLLAFCGYKYVGMILAILGGLFFASGGYYITLIYCSASLVYFLMRNLKMFILGETDNENFGHGSKRRIYILLFITTLQPIFMYWLTYHFISGSSK